MTREDDIQKAAALCMLIAYGSHIHLRPHELIKTSEADERLKRMQQEYLTIVRDLWPAKDNRCNLTQEECRSDDPRDNYCPVHGRDIR